MDVLKIRSLQYIKRFNYESCIKYQSVAEHSMMCALIAYDFCKIYNYDYKIVIAALLHDVAESVIGDIPYLVKSFIDKKEINKLEFAAYKELKMEDPIRGYEDIVSFIDILELCIYLQEERLRGNKNLINIEAESRGRLEKYPIWLKYTWTLLDNLVPSKVMPKFLKH